MAIKEEIVRARLKEAIGTDSQGDVAKKIHTTQGSVSKLLSGEQSLTLDKACAVAEKYGVSLDWLMGMSNKKRPMKNGPDISYVSIVKSLLELKKSGHTINEGNYYKDISIQIHDPLLRMLYQKGAALMTAGEAYLETWVEKSLEEFDKPLVWSSIWNDPSVDFALQHAITDKEWLEVYRIAKEEEENQAELYYEPSPFNNI